MAIDDGVLEYEVRGQGEPVVLINPGAFADWFAPLLEQPSLTDSYRLILYQRPGCAGSSRLTGPVSLSRHAAICRSVMGTLGIERAHLVGHSSSGNLALQLALDAPEVVHSLAILEPALELQQQAVAADPELTPAARLRVPGVEAATVEALRAAPVFAQRATTGDLFDPVVALQLTFGG